MQSQQRFTQTILIMLALVLLPAQLFAKNQGKVSVRIGYFANLTHAPALLAVHSGDLDKRLGPSAEVKTKIFNAGPSLIEAMFAKQIDIGYVGPGPALNGFIKSRGEGLKVIAGAAANGVLIVTRADSKVKSLEDLRGLRIGTPQLGNTQDVSARHFVSQILKEKNLSKILPAPNAEMAGLLARGDIDAAWVPEPWGTMMIEEGGARVLAEEKDLWPTKEFALTIVIVRPQFLKDHPDLVEKFLSVHVDWINRLQKSSSEDQVALGKAIEALTNRKVNEKTIKNSIQRIKFTLDPMPTTLVEFDKRARDLRFSRENADVPSMIDLTLLNKLRSSKGERK